MKMRKTKTRLAALLLGMLVMISLTGCANLAPQQSVPQTQVETSEPATETAQAQMQAQAETVSTAKLKAEDLNTDWDDTATKITLNGASISVDGSGASANESILTISSAGTYVVSGTLTDGQIKIDATKKDLIHLVLNGATVTNTTGAAIHASQCDKLVITLSDGTQNSLTDGGSNYQYADQAEEEPNAALFSKDDLTINGAGSLTVNAGFNNGIGTKDDLLIVSGNITVSAPNHALRGNDSVTVVAGTFNLTAGSDGIQTNNTEEADKGYVLIEGGTLDITAGNDAIQADTALTVSGGTLTISAGGSAKTSSDSYKGLKSAGDLTISGGSIDVRSQDDSVHANGSITISGGLLSLATGDDGVHADADLTVSGGDITVTQSYEGLEAANILISGGTIRVTSSDDGINAAGGMDSSGMGGGFGRDMFGSSGNYSITITGGSLYITAGGDGIDSNGSFTMSGGTVVSLIQSSSDNGGLDCDGTISVTGGTLIYGGTGVGGVTSPQSYAYMSGSISAGSEISLVKDGQTITTFTAAIACQQLIISAPGIASGQSYTFTQNGNQIATATAGSGGGDMMFGGRGGGMRGGRGGR